MAYIRSHETKQRARGKTVKTYAVVYRAKVRSDDGRVVSRLRQETHATKAAAEARVATIAGIPLCWCFGCNRVFPRRVPNG